jgi:Rps23 Pro-64 3,4-dihydroxylase Tpa1-like proline 4-hydroxylase
MSFLEYSLRKMLDSKEFINILNEITGLDLKNLTTMFLSKYKSGNFLSPHSDKGNGKLAFVINLTKFWKPQYGGALHFMNNDRTEIIDTIVPSFNTFFIFNVPSDTGIPHFVSHIAPNVKYSRYAITGWFS